MNYKILYGLFILGFVSCQSSKNECDKKKEYIDSYRTKTRVNVYPNKHCLLSNPPSFLWPVTNHDKDSVSFQIKLVKEGTTDTIVSRKLNWAVWKPTEILDIGEWSWILERYRGNKKERVGTYSFLVEEKLPIYNPPKIGKKMINDFYGDHPRFFQLNAKGPQISERLPKDLQKNILDNAAIFVAEKVLNKTDPFSEIDKRLTKFEIGRVKINISKKILNHLRLKVLYLAEAYTLTKDRIYAEAALKKFKNFEELPNEVKQLNDFTRGMSLDLCLCMFDGFYQELSISQKEYIIDLCYPIIHHEYEGARMRFEAQEFDNHVWQKGIALMARASLIMGKHIPEATEWMEYVADVWAARAPAGGFNFDGAWTNGNSYFTANIITLIQTPMILNKISGFDYLSHPWYQNLAKAMIITYQAKSYSNGFGDGHDSTTMPVWVRGQLANYVARGTQNPYLTWYANQIALSERGTPPSIYDANSKHPLDSEAHQWIIGTMAEKIPKAKIPIFKRGEVFEYSGIASIHSNLLESNSNMHLAFRSSIYGSGSHTMCNQNAFNVIVGGKPLFLSSGYYTNFSDKHNLLHYRNTRGHNTVLINGVGQSLGKHGYGEIEASLITDDIAYVRGDASNAYRGELRSPMWIKKMKISNVAYSKDNGFGVTTLKKYKRHLLMLEKRTIIIYDELEADEPSKFEWLLHTPGKFTKVKNNRIKAVTNNASASVYIDASSRMKTNLLIVRIISLCKIFKQHTVRAYA